MKEEPVPVAEVQPEVPRDQVYTPPVTAEEQSSFKIPVEQLSPDGVELLNRACQDDNLSSSGTIRMQTSAGALLSLAEGVPLQCGFEQDGSYKLTAISPSDHFDTALKILGPHLQAGRLSWQAQDDSGHLCLTALLADIGAGSNNPSAVHANAVSAIASAVAAAAAAAAGVTSPTEFTRISNLAGSISNITSELASAAGDQGGATPAQNLDAAVEDILTRPSHLQQFMLQALQQQLGKDIVKGPRTGTKGIKVHVSKVDKRELLPTASTDVPASLVVCDGEGGSELHTVPDTMLESRPRSDDPNMYWYSIRYPRSGAPHINEKTTKWKLDMDSTGRLLVTALIGTYEAPSRSDANTPKQTYVQQPVRKPPPPPPKLQIYRAQMDKMHKDILDRHLQGIYNHYGATTQVLPGAILLKYQATTGEIVGPFPTDVTVIIKKEIRQNRLPGWKYYIPTENLPSHINLEMEKVLWWVISEEDGHIVLTVYPDRDSAPIAALMDSAQRTAIEQQRARLALPPPHQLVLPHVPGSGQKRPRSPNALSAAQSLRKLARSAPTDGTPTEGDEDWGRSNSAIVQRLAAVAGAGPSGAAYPGADVITDVMPATDVKSAVATRTHHVKAAPSRAAQLPAHLRVTFGKPPDLSGGWPSLPHGDSWTEVVQGLLKSLRFLGAEKVMIARWWHWVSQREGVRGWYRRMLLAWQVSQKLNNVDQVQAIFSKRDRELLEQFFDSSASWGQLPEVLEGAKLRTAPVENLLVDNKVSCSDFITEAVYALKAADLVSMEQANDALLPLLMDTVPDGEVVKCAKRMEKFWTAQDVEGMMWAFLCLASEKASA